MQSNLRLIRQTMTNFKGARNVRFEPNGCDAAVHGANATGKTTLLDGFLWLLFDKDSAGRKDFEIKTQDAAGRAIPMLDHSVELVLDKDGEQVTLRKTLSESWVKARGAATAAFSGHKVVYEIDGAPRQKKEFDAVTGRLCAEGLLRLLVDPVYFAAKLPWQERRNILLELCGELGDAEVIAADPRLQALPGQLAGRSIEQQRKLLAARKTLVNEELKAIPVRVDEVSRSLPEDSSASPAQLDELTQQTRAALEKVEAELLETGGAGLPVGPALRLQQLSAALLQLQNQQEAARQMEQRHSDCRVRLDALATEAAELAAQMDEKRRLWNQVEASLLAVEPSECCPSCGQALPAEQLQAARDKAQQAFDHERKQRLERITAAGTALAAQHRQLLQRLGQQEAALAELERQLQPSSEAAARQRQIDSLQRERQAVEQQSAGEPTTEKSAQAARRERCRERDELRQRLELLSRQRANGEQQAQGQMRIDELRRREQALADEYAELEQQTFLSEEFIRVKVGLLEARINSRFKLARFRLFEQQVNGALSEVCEVLGPDGAPYNGGLNNAARINTGIDIINTLAAHYGMTAPLFIDNAEAVNQLIDTQCQLIRLLVSEADNALNVTLKPKGAEGPRYVGLLPDAEMPVAELPAAAEPTTGPTAGPGF